MKRVADSKPHGTPTSGTPEETLARLAPHLAALGITGGQDATAYDRIGLPIYDVARQTRWGVRMSHGKGFRPIDAQVTAYMEAVEVFHAENPDCQPRRASFRAMARAGRRPVDPRVLPDFRSEASFSKDLVTDWVKGENLATQQAAWLPASAAFPWKPTLFDYSSNGLAGGSDLDGATLHGLYETIERDAVSRLCVNGRMEFSEKRCRLVDVHSLPEGPLDELRERLVAAKAKLLLVWLRSCIPVHSFMAVVLDANPPPACTTVSLGYGTHPTATGAAIRAITEAIQSRLISIPGWRDVPITREFQAARQASFDFFDTLEGRTPWAALPRCGANQPSRDLRWVVERLGKAGFPDIYRFNLTRQEFQIPVVKVLVPGLGIDRRIFAVKRASQ